MTTTHEHDHAQGAGPTRLAVALALTSTVLLGEVVVGWLSGSLSLLADAGHMATDSAGLVVALLAAHLASRPSTDRSTWGMRRSEVIGAALQAGMLSLVGVTVAVRAVLNLVRPETIHADGMLVMGVIGLAANLASLLVLSGGHAASLNMRAAILEVTGDALGSLGVIVAGFVIRLTGWVQADAVASLLIAALIVPRAGALLRAAGRVLMDFTPTELDLAEVRRHLGELPEVLAVHDLHAWRVSSDLPVLSAHVVVKDACLDAGRYEELLDALQQCVAEHFPVRITHATFQIEPAGHSEHEAECC
ncbi:cation diffusion facilitator family transporter [Actinomyces urogenitalis DSM 15434]|uniref:Cation diffusion facilitator family transporter n=1 Tax=Actinomyces urogenitalis DSM 15434 TaxID=525246 RepID=C0W6Y4_9ACTO|nr:cation diffusion facilitator family transporter [Actinomyces urogenitalis]EEH65658.1 cation diffusion facilitator family transporter [Actinomyces urogenitalis DSM 15434]